MLGQLMSPCLNWALGKIQSSLCVFKMFMPQVQQILRMSGVLWIIMRLSETWDILRNPGLKSFRIVKEIFFQREIYMTWIFFVEF